MRTFFLFLVGIIALRAAEPMVLARLVEGTVTRDDQPLAVGAELSAGQRLVVAGKFPVRLDFTAPTKGTLLLLPESEITLTSAVEAGQSDLIVDLHRGRVETKLDALGDFASLQVRGAALSIHVTGTIFVVDRTRRDTDYVAMVLGKVSVTLRREIAELLRRNDPPIELIAGQGLGGNTQSGLGQPQTLTVAASISSFPKAVAGLGLVPEAGFAPGAGTGGVLDTGGGSSVGGPDINSADPESGAAPAIVSKGDIDIPAVNIAGTFDPSLPQQVVEEVTRAVTDQITNRVVEEVTQQVIGTIPSDLPGAPALP
jgi:putative lipoic acid-binding regulatory protein